MLLQPLDVKIFKPFKIAFRKERDNAMVKNNQCEPNKCTLASWVDKSFNKSLTQKNIKSGFKVKGIWPLNPKAMDHKIRPSNVFTTTLANILDEDNEGFDDTTNEQKQWGENGVISQLTNITPTSQELETPKENEH
jgi:hypothetical protein